MKAKYEINQTVYTKRIDDRGINTIDVWKVLDVVKIDDGSNSYIITTNEKDGTPIKKQKSENVIYGNVAEITKELFG